MDLFNSADQGGAAASSVAATLVADWPPERRLLVCDESGAGAPVARALTAGTVDAAAPWALLTGPMSSDSSTAIRARGGWE